MLCKNEDCNFCFEKSFASHEKSKYWSDKNELKTRDVFKGSRNKYLFYCNKCNHDFESALFNVSKGKWCPYCVNKTEQKLYDKISLIYPELIRQYKVEWCKNIFCLPFDFCIPKYKNIIELDGPQHFRQVSNWNSPKKNKENDKFKEECANNNGYSIIRLLQEDVMNDTYDWVKKLCEAIEELKNGYEIANIYICKNNEYNDFL